MPRPYVLSLLVETKISLVSSLVWKLFDIQPHFISTLLHGIFASTFYSYVSCANSMTSPFVDDVPFLDITLYCNMVDSFRYLTLT